MPASGAQNALWLGIAVACQFLWGTYPAGVRYMQTKAEHPLTSLQLSLLINLLACPALFFGTTLPLWIATKWRARQARRGSLCSSPAGPAPQGKVTPANGSPLAASPAWDSALAEPLLGPSDAGDGAAPGDVERAAAAPEPSAPPAPNGVLPEVAPSAEEPPADAQRVPEGRGAGWKAQARVLLLTTFFLSSLFLAQVFSLLFTTAYLSQMVFLLAPVIVALAAKLLFKSPLPKGLWTALFLMLLGCGMVIASKATAPPKANGQLATPGLWAGRAEEAWLCTSMLGERWGSRLCGLVADPGNGANDEWAGGDADGSGAPRKRPGAAEEPTGGSDTASLVGDPLLEGGAEVEDGRAHRKSGAVGKKPKPGPKPKPKPGPKPKPRPKPHHSSGFGMRDVLGIGLSFFGACCVAGFMTVVQRTHGTCSDQQVLWANFLTQIPICLALTATFERGRLGALLHLGLKEVAEVFALAAGVNWFANWVQQMCIRNLGAPQAAAFLPMRLLGSLAASYPLLGEGLEGPLQWGGVAILLAAVSWYLLQQKKAAEEGSRSTASLLQHEASGPVYVA